MWKQVQGDSEYERENDGIKGKEEEKNDIHIDILYILKEECRQCFEPLGLKGKNKGLQG